ncbi:MAG TPA: ABC transporter permease [Phycisphaerales bacterium]|nr:ABC transporter permease [Phycisphaerales bacterium]
MLIKGMIKPESLYTETHKKKNLLGRKNYLFLTLVIAVTDFKIKYDNSVLGYLWSLLKPLLMFGTLYLVFSVFVRWQVENYRLYLLLGIILWNFLSEVTLNSMVLLEGKASILKKIYFPRWIIVIASSLTSLLTLLLNMVVFFIFFIFSGAHFQTSALLLVVYLVELYILVVGLALLLCSLFPKFRDIHHIWEVFVQLGFWATPIIYPISIVPEKYHTLIFLNPVARIIQGCRQALIGSGSEFLSFTNHIIIISVAVCLFVLGLGMFNKLSRSFAEDL